LFLSLPEKLPGVRGHRGHEHKLDTPKRGRGGNAARGGVERDDYDDADRADARDDERPERGFRRLNTGAGERIQL
jgi:hypothetical protein